MKQLFVVLFLVSASLAAVAQDVLPIKLKQERVGYAPKGFYVHNVVDDRPGDDGLGAITENRKKSTIKFAEGAAASLNSFVSAHLTQNKSTTPISLHITKIDFQIKKNGASWRGDALVIFTFYAGEEKLIEYSGKGHAEMDSDPGKYIESFIRQSVEKDLKAFDTWWAQNTEKIPTSDEVRVVVRLAKTTDKPNTIIYSAQRPLSISDFNGRPEHNVQEMAATVSGIGFSYSSSVQKGQLVIAVTITPYFDKEQSWFREAGKNTNVLAHEQLHFDITANKACELVNTLRNTAFTKQNYAALLDKLQQQNAEAAGKEQDKYDNESNHGIVRDQQAAWTRKINEQLKASTCY